MYKDKQKTDDDPKTKYNKKKVESFKTKFKLFLFTKAFGIKTIDELIEDTGIVDEFINFKINKELTDKYTTEYYQKDYPEEITYDGYTLIVTDIWEKKMSVGADIDLFGLTNDNKRNTYDEKYKDFYQKLKGAYDKTFEDIFSFSAFEKILEDKNCQYCGISVDQIYKLGEKGKLHNKRSETRGYSLEIDRKKPNEEYTEENCCMACYWCNNAKTDEFLPHEFQGIAKGISDAWNMRFKECRLGEPVIFPEQSPIWKK